MRVVFDTNTVVSALLFRRGRLHWLRAHWHSGAVIALVSADTAGELIRVLAYPKFRLEAAEINALLADYLPYTEVVAVSSRGKSPRCRDPDDQMFVDLALQGRADVLVSGDRALLEMEVDLPVLSPADYHQRYVRSERR
jgi:putative PIN family toxin of toxin-antitoxin system